MAIEELFAGHGTLPQMFSDRTAWNLEPNPLSKALANQLSSGKPVTDLTESNPTKCGFHFETEQILGALSHPASVHYDPVPQGLLPARSAVVDYYQSRGCAINVNDIFLTTSTSEAYSFLFRTLCNPGDEVLIPQPGYPLFNFLADIQDVATVRYPLIYDYGWQIDFHALQRAITPRTRAIIVVNPNNPTGHFCKAKDVHRLNQFCLEGNLALIADEVFLDFSLGNDITPTFACNDKALTFTMSGLSKISGLPQMKVSWLIATGPQALKHQAVARLEMIADTYLSMNTPMQLALPVLLELRHNFQQQCVERTQKNLAQLDKLLSTQKLCARLNLEGGWYAILKVPLTGSDGELALELLNTHGVYVHPGHFYDFPADGYLVVSLITPELPFAAGIRDLVASIDQKFRKDS
ncbi:MAG TPA: pyridoxal phosphate-dependent aminotransferase [Methylomirabilota bacterium]|jgi:aspartate/methionine/tyrosine aminotransferase|nr:pyridoxal phosphate-dependent aminotransferase [Methylomirabilota bacterium]